jgi:uncharacterized protein
MSKGRVLTKEDAKAAALGGTVLGGGGGGSRKDGEKMGLQALETGTVNLVSIDKFAPEDILLTVSAVGAPAAKYACALPADYVRVVELFCEAFHCNPAGIITNECGGNATMNGWLQAATLNLPLVDASCNGRAHPTGLMGALSLQKQSGFLSQQAAVGGDQRRNCHIEITTTGTLEKASSFIRLASVEAEGLVAVARNPVCVAYAKKHAALGAIEQCIQLGKTMYTAKKNGQSISRSAADFLGGEILIEGLIEKLQIETHGGFDVGHLQIRGAERSLELTFWNEYMTLEDSGQRIGTFPDLLMTFSVETGLPLSSAEIREGMNVQVLHTKSSYLYLGSGMHDRELFKVAEKAVGKDIISHVFKNKGDFIWH